jgi:hypothetical protein
MSLPVKKKHMDLVLDEESAAEAILDESSKGPTPFLKFKKDKYVIGKDITVPLATRFIAYPGDWRRGWAKFVGDQKIDEKICRVADDPTVLERDELGDLDQSEWEIDEDGKPKEPWTFQHYVPLENAKTGDGNLGGNAQRTRLPGRRRASHCEGEEGAASGLYENLRPAGAEGAQARAHWRCEEHDRRADRAVD